MLVEFYVENYKSFSEKTVFSLVADNHKARGKNFFVETSFKDNGKPINLMTFVCVFGSNASGKTSLLNAFKDFQQLLLTSLRDTRGFDAFYSKKNKFSTGNDKEVSFGIKFILDDNYYEYDFKINKEEVLYESLKVKNRKARSQLITLFERKKDKYSVHNTLKKEQNRQILVSEKALFLSLALLSRKGRLFPIFDYLMRDITIGLGNRDFSEYTTRSIHRDEGEKTKVVEFLKITDIAIDNIVLKGDVPKGLLEIIDIEDIDEEIKKELKDSKVPVFQIKDKQGNFIDFEKEEISTGTNTIYNLASVFLNVLKKGEVLFIDEMERSLHPKAVNFLINLFSNEETNPRGAQLIVTTHDPLILQYPLVYKDQIYLIEKGKYSSELIRLDEYEGVDKRRDLMKMYLNGSFGAVPNISTFSSWMLEEEINEEEK